TKRGAMTRTARSLATKAGIAGTLAAALVLAGCSGDSGGEKQGGFDPNEEIELTIAWWGNDERSAMMAEVIDAFEEKYPNITVVEQPVGAPDDLFKIGRASCRERVE